MSRDPLTQLVYNVNGFSARWKAVLRVSDDRPGIAKKYNPHRRIVVPKADFISTIMQAGNPDIISITESKINLRKLMSLQGFVEWCDTSLQQPSLKSVDLDALQQPSLIAGGKGSGSSV